MGDNHSFFKFFFSRFKRNRAAYTAFIVFIFLSLVGIYAPLFACSKPFIVKWQGVYYFPFFRFLFFKGFYTKSIDLFFNVLMLTFPLAFVSWILLRKKAHKYIALGVFVFLQGLVFFPVNRGFFKNPGGEEILQKTRLAKIEELNDFHKNENHISFPQDFRNWEFEKQFISTYDKLGLLLSWLSKNSQHESLQEYTVSFETKEQRPLPTLKYLEEKHDRERLRRLTNKLEKLKNNYQEYCVKWENSVNDYKPFLMALTRAEHESRISEYLHASDYEDKQRIFFEVEKAAEAKKQEVIFYRKYLEDFVKTKSDIAFIRDKQKWLLDEASKVKIICKPLLRCYHWEEDTGIAGEINRHIPWWELSRINGRDLMSSLLFGIRICLVVGFLGASISLILGISVGLVSGYFGGKVDIICSRIVEIWEMMPVLFILLLIVSISQVKSLFISTLILGLFGWTGFARYLRAEVLRERTLPYVLAARSMGYTNWNIMFCQILPNVFSCIISLVPFTVMAMISSEAGLTFLGLGEENTTSWGTLMREGVNSFPSESYLLWPPATVLTVFLIAIALMGDGIRDALDPRLRE